MLVLSACTPPPPVCTAPVAEANVVTLVDRGWHVEIGLPADSLVGGLAVFRDIFPGARSVLFGYGKRTFFTAKTDSLSEYLLGPVPGPAAIQATGLSVPAAQAYPAGDVTVLPLTPDGGGRIAAFIWAEIARDATGGPKLIGPGPFPGSLFYAASSGYDLGHTCNTWVADALQAGGLNVSPRFVVLSGQVVSRAVHAGACRPAP